MNAVGGFVRSTGEVEVFGRPVTGRAPHRRAALGLGRSFQDAALYPDLTVRETVAVAVEARHHVGLATVVVGLPRARRVERAKLALTDDVLEFLGLGPYADRFVSELSTGMRRIVELACLLATESRVLCLDEPTSGIAQREAEAFGPLLLRVRAELEASMLVIEHDMPLVMSISDRITASRPAPSSPRARRTRSGTTRGSSPRTSAPTSAPSPAAARRRPRRPPPPPPRRPPRSEHDRRMAGPVLPQRRRPRPIGRVLRGARALVHEPHRDPAGLRGDRRAPRPAGRSCSSPGRRTRTARSSWAPPSGSCT